MIDFGISEASKVITTTYVAAVYNTCYPYWYQILLVRQHKVELQELTSGSLVSYWITTLGFLVFFIGSKLMGVNFRGQYEFVAANPSHLD